MVEAGRQMVTTVSVTEGYDMNAIAVGASASKATQVLAPLTFPSIPPKGELDVKAVMDSFSKRLYILFLQNNFTVHKRIDSYVQII